MIPAKRTFLLLLLLVLAGVVTALIPAWSNAWMVMLVISGILLLGDASSAWSSSPPEIDREMSSSLPLGVETPVTLQINNRTGRPIRVEYYDHHPASLQTTDLPQSGLIEAGHRNAFRYRVTPTRRGRFEFDTVQVRVLSPLGLWWRDRKIETRDTVHVYPNFSAVTKYILLATMDRVQQMGIRKRRRRGEGSEFHQLREFREGDSLRQVDWRATARHGKLISKEYQDERDQNIIILLDCGRRMRTQDDELSHFDHALNAMLLLTYVALRQGDAVGIGTFSGESRWVKPIRGAGMLNTILNNVYDLEPSAEAPDYSRAAMNLLARQRKRSLVIVITNLRDEDGDDLLPALKLLKTKHTVLLASLREAAIDNVLHQEVTGFTDALTMAATHQYLDERNRAISWLVNNGINCLDVVPGELSVQLVNHYLAMKAANVI
jgi:uncharacterized protein (DUF58 family)